MSLVYPGLELDVFATAVQWKRYIGDTLAPFIQGRVVEIGAGLGSNIPYLINSRVTDWLSLEPDPSLASRLGARIAADRDLATRCRAQTGTIESLPGETRFDTVLYIDVLEHIADDAAEFARAAALLRPGGHLIVLAPAHPFLFTPFDTAVGHFRRYTAQSLASLAGSPPIRMLYLDRVGCLASLANRLLLRSATPTMRQIGFWDRALVPLSRRIDPLLGHKFGKTVVGTWANGDTGPTRFSECPAVRCPGEAPL